MKRVIALGLLLLVGRRCHRSRRQTPQDVIQDTSTRMIDALRQNRAKLDRDPGQIYGLVDQIVLPNFDFELMSRWVLGRPWQQASPDQRRRFTEEFRTLLVRTYAKALLEYSGEDIRLLPQPTVGTAAR